jgi:oxaloacetate decarboxylase
LNCTPRRLIFKNLLGSALKTGEPCVFPASIHDPLSARMAQALGFEVGMLAGSVASMTVLGAPDWVVLTLSELVEQAHRITRASDLPLLVDADHGFGNALNVRRTVEELESAGVAALTIEDTRLPASHSNAPQGVISMPEALGKFQAALDARQDPNLSVLARSTALSCLPLEQALERLANYAKLEVDGLFVVGVKTWETLEAVQNAVHAVKPLPLVLGNTPKSLHDAARLARLGVSLALQGHESVHAGALAVFETLKRIRQRNGHELGPSTPLEGDVIDHFLQEPLYAEWLKRYLDIQP